MVKVPEPVTVETVINGETYTIETGWFARQADGAVIVKQGDTAVLVTAVMSDEAQPDIDFLPLTVDYREKTYAYGKIPGGFVKREGKPNVREILVSRLIDRPVRPLFPKGFFNDVVITALTLSADDRFDPDVLAIVGASAALHISRIPFEGLLEAIFAAHEDIKAIIEIQERLREKVGVEKFVVEKDEKEAEIKEKIREFAAEKLKEAFSIKEKRERRKRLDDIFEQTVQALEISFPEYMVLLCLQGVKPKRLLLQPLVLQEKNRLKRV